MIMKKAKWIWLEAMGTPDSYGEFYEKFLWEQGSALCRISCDGDYTLYINGQAVSFWQYGDYEHYKVYDEIDITPYLQKGENHLAVRVWHYGVDSMRYIAAQAGLIYEIAQGSQVLVFSSENVRCRLSKAFINERKKNITWQLGMGFAYDANYEDNWKIGYMADGKPAVSVKKSCQMVKRPIAKNSLEKPAKSTCLVANKGYYLFDLGQETVGLPVLKFTSETAQDILVQWGEDLQNGHVRRIIDQRDFSFNYRAKPGKNEFISYMLRIGCRYIEIFAESPVEIEYVGVFPTPYPVEIAPMVLEDSLDQKIYDTCVRTLQLCMMDRYVDTPWREQCLYAFDARNQMLCGYYAFKDGNTQFARAALKLISEDRREDGLLSITYPCGMDLTIPGFSLHYFKAVREYCTHTGDWGLAKEVYPKLKSILDTFISGRKNGFICRFSGENHWNFYDWSDYLEGRLFEDDVPIPDLIINCLFIIACWDFLMISEKIGMSVSGLNDLIIDARKGAINAFCCPEKALFSLTQGGGEFTVLGNALAILAGLTDETQAKDICSRFGKGEMTDCTLSMKCFQYDAMLKTDKTFSKEILAEIRAVYGKMLESGATSVWETAVGAAAFDNAGSLCHGWSAVPIYYYNLSRDDVAVLRPESSTAIQGATF